MAANLRLASPSTHGRHLLPIDRRLIFNGRRPRLNTLPPKPPANSQIKNRDRPTLPPTNPQIQNRDRTHILNQFAAKPSPNTTTVYFEGFPDGWSPQNLSKVFISYGVHGIVSLAWKRNRRNLRFDFLCVHQDHSISSVITAINMIVIGKYRLRAFKAKFPGKKSTPNLISIGKQPVAPTGNQKQDFAASVLKTTDGRSFAEVVSKPIIVSDEVMEPEWLSRSCVMVLRSIKDLIGVRKILDERNFGFQNITPLGDNRIIITFCSIEALRMFCSEEWKHLQDLLSEIRSASGIEPAGRRLTWLKLYGIPVRYYHLSIIETIAAQFGEYIYVHDDLTHCNRLDMWPVLVGAGLNCLEGNYNIVVNGEPLNIYVNEDDAFLSLDFFSARNNNSSSGVSKSATVQMESKSCDGNMETNGIANHVNSGNVNCGFEGATVRQKKWNSKSSKNADSLLKDSEGADLSSFVAATTEQAYQIVTVHSSSAEHSGQNVADGSSSWRSDSLAFGSRAVVNVACMMNRLDVGVNITSPIQEAPIVGDTIEDMTRWQPTGNEVMILESENAAVLVPKIRGEN